MHDRAAQDEEGGVSYKLKFAELDILRIFCMYLTAHVTCLLAVCKICIVINYTLDKVVCQFCRNRQCCQLLAAILSH